MADSYGKGGFRCRPETVCGEVTVDCVLFSTHYCVYSIEYRVYSIEYRQLRCQNDLPILSVENIFGFAETDGIVANSVNSR